MSKNFRKYLLMPLIPILLPNCEESNFQIEEKEINVSFIIDSDTKSEPIDEIRNLSVLQFDNSTGILLKKLYVPDWSSDMSIPVLTTRGMSYDIYFIANLYDISSKYTVNRTRIEEVDTASFACNPSGEFSLIPFSGKYRWNPYDSRISVKMTRAVSKLSLSVNTSVFSDSICFEIGEAVLKNVPSRGKIFATGGVYPTGISGLRNYPVKNIRIGETITWHLPENKSQYSTKVLISTGYQYYHQFDLGEMEILLNGTSRDVHLHYNVEVSNLTDSRIRWFSSGNRIRYYEEGIDRGKGIYYYKGVWAPTNLGKSSINPYGIFYQHRNFIENDTIWNIGTETKPVKSYYDPCPDGWRIPTQKEWYFTFLDSEYKYEFKSFEGRYYYSNYPGRDTLLFDAGGMIVKDSYIGEGWECCYWTSYTPSGGSCYYTFSTITNYRFVRRLSDDKVSIRCIFDRTDYIRKHHHLNNN